MTQIPYLDEHIGAISGCSGRGCKAYCWARDMVRRFPAIHNTKKMIYGHMAGPIDIETIPHPFEQVQFHPDRLAKPLHWKKPRRIGLCFTGDWMDDQVEPSWIDQILEVVAACPQHQFFSLTKQPKKMGQYFDHLSLMLQIVGTSRLPIPNLWNGVSITDQEDADRMIPDLLRIPGKRWISYEPALGPVDFNVAFWVGPEGGWEYEGSKRQMIDLLVLGPETGPKRRPCKIEWMIDVMRQCKAAGVPVWVKAISINGKVERDINKFPPELRVRELA